MVLRCVDVEGFEVMGVVMMTMMAALVLGAVEDNGGDGPLGVGEWWWGGGHVG